MSQPDLTSIESQGSAAPPPGLRPNFTNPYSLEIYFTITICTCLPIVTLVVWIRLCTRIQIIKSAEWEDLCMLLAWMGVVGYAVPGVIAFRDGVGSHQWDVPVLKGLEARRAIYITEPIYRMTLVFAKLAILLQLLGIFVPSRRGTIYHAVIVLIWFNVLSHVASIFAAIFQCAPVQKAWNPTVQGNCINVTALVINTAAINVFSDFSILLLPMISIWQLQMPVRRKGKVSAIFSLGFIACAASVVHLVYDIKITRTQDLRSLDLSWDMAPILLSAYAHSPTLP